MAKILVVEDEKPLLEAITTKLNIKGYEVIQALTGESALAKLKENPDLVWLDLLLPQMQGIEFLKKMRSIEEYKDLPVIVVSNSGSKERIKDAFDLNVVDYMVKADHGLGDIIKKIEKAIN